MSSFRSLKRGKRKYLDKLAEMASFWTSIIGVLLTFVLYALDIDFTDLLAVDARPFALVAPGFLTGLIFPTLLIPASSTSWGKEAFVPEVVIGPTQPRRASPIEDAEERPTELSVAVVWFAVFQRFSLYKMYSGMINMLLCDISRYWEVESVCHTERNGSACRIRRCPACLCAAVSSSWHAVHRTYNIHNQSTHHTPRPHELLYNR